MYLFEVKQLLFPHVFCKVQKGPKSTAAGAPYSAPPDH